MDSHTIAKRNDNALAAAVAARKALHGGINISDRNRFVLENKRVHPFYGFVDVHVSSSQPFVMFCNNDDPVALHYFWCGKDAWEPTSLALWTILCGGAKGAVLDVGAFSGLYSLVAHAARCRRVIAFEPSRMPLARLLDNINTNGAASVEVVPKAASDYEGTTFFNLARGLRTLSTAGRLEGAGDEGLREPVVVGTLDGELRALNVDVVALAKINVEGAEISALRGMVETLQKDRPDLLIEIKHELLPRVDNMLGELGYKGLCIIEEDKSLVNLKQSPKGLQNYYFSSNRARQASLVEMFSK